MAGINKVIIIGNLGRDPEMRNTTDGTAVVHFSVATSRQWTDRNSGEKREDTEWHRIVAWHKLAELCNQYLSKGKQVYVEGRLKTRSWVDENNTTRYQTEIVAEQIQFLSNKSGGNEKSYTDSLVESTPPPDSKKDINSYDDLPF